MARGGRGRAIQWGLTPGGMRTERRLPPFFLLENERVFSKFLQGMMSPMVGIHLPARVKPRAWGQTGVVMGKGTGNGASELAEEIVLVFGFGVLLLVLGWLGEEAVVPVVVAVPGRCHGVAPGFLPRFWGL